MQSQAIRKIPQNEDLTDSISVLISTKLTEFRSQMTTLINKNGDQPMSLGDRDSYYEDFKKITYPKQKKAKQEIPTPMTCLHCLKILQKIIMEQ